MEILKGIDKKVADIYGATDVACNFKAMIKKMIMIAAVGCLLAPSEGRASVPTVTWENRGHVVNAEGKSAYLERFTIDCGEQPFSRLAFCVNKHEMKALNPLDTVVEILPGYYAVGSPRFADAVPGDTIVVDILTEGWMHNAFEAPDGMHLVADGKSIAAKNVRLPFTRRREQWVSALYGKDPMVYGQRAFAINDSLRSGWRPAPYMQIPTPKKVTTKGKMTRIPMLKAARAEDSRHSYYRVAIEGDTATVFTNSRAPETVLADVRRRLEQSADADGMVPAATIEDWADYGYRGLMIDVARNFTPKDDIKRMITLMSRYGLNVLHFHLGDDEGWRVEIPGLPELTEVGSRRGYTTDDNVDFLKQIYSGDGDPLSATPANGFFTEEDFIEILRHAHALGIDVIPEFDSPGHSRAAIRAMEHRGLTTGDDSLRLIHDGDTSKYSTAQYFHDNLMNPALEGPYRFWGKVMDGIIDLYSRAGVPLRSIHVGGDEVPEHAWDGSDKAVAFMKEHGMTNQRELFAYYFERLAALAAERGIKISGWQELALGHTGSYDEKVRPVMESVNSWTNAGTQGSRMAAAGYPVVMSNVDYLYFDQTPTRHPEEPGFTWGGLVDEFRPLHATPARLCPGDEETRRNIAGISAHLFAETIRNPGMVERYLFPRLLGLAERAHNSGETLADDEYFGIITDEMPRWAADGMQFYLRQPGIRVSEGMVEMNEPYGFGEIRYTLDGSEPTRESLLYEGPFKAPDDAEIRARLFFGPSWSVTTILDK